MTSIGTLRGCSGWPRRTLSRLNATRLPSPTALTTISGWPEPSCTMSPAAKNFVSPRRPNRSTLIVPRSVLNSSGSHLSDACWPTAMITLSTAKRSAGRLAIDRDRRGIDRAAESGGVELERFHAGRCRARAVIARAVHQLDALLEHVVQIFRHRRHLGGVLLDGDHRHFLGALAERFAGAVDRGVAATDDGHARAELDGGSAHPDVAQERQPIEHAVLVLAFGTHAVRLGEAHRQDAGVVVVLQLVPGDVLANLGVGLDRDAQLDEALDLAIEHVLRKHPVGNAAAIETTGLRRLFEIVTA